jgi:tripartite ATP-independent transporter DctM subunit
MFALEPTTVGILSITLVFLLIFSGIYVALALGIVGCLGAFLVTGNLNVAGRLLSSSAYSNVNDYIFSVIPLFILMGALATSAGATKDLFSACNELTKRIRGGLGMSVVFANAMFAAITGVSVASAAVFTKIALPEMRRRRYQDRFSFGIIATSSLLGMLLPPSLLMIVYGVLTEQSIGMLFAAGIGPGLLLIVTMAIFIWFRVHWNPKLINTLQTAENPAPTAEMTTATDEVKAGLAETMASDMRVRWNVVGKAWPAYLLMGVVIVGIYRGFFTPTEAAAVAAFGALLLYIRLRGLRVREMHEIIMESGSMTGSILILLLTAGIYSKMLALTGLPNYLTSAVLDTNVQGIVVVIGCILILLLLGAVLDSVSMMLVTVPIMFPLVMQLGYDPLWFGMVVIFTIEMGLLTPPFGMVLFTIMSSSPGELQYRDPLMGVTPFLLLLLVNLCILVMVPEISTYFPKLIFG